jgi:hypothetical protein
MQGKVYVVEWANPGDACDIRDPVGALNQCRARREFFWLCKECSRTMTLAVNGSQVVAVSRDKAVSDDVALIRELRIAS